MDRLLHLIVEAHLRWLEGCHHGRPYPKNVIAALKSEPVAQPCPANVPSVVAEYLPAAVATIQTSWLQDLGKELLISAEKLNWVATPTNYFGEAFARNYAYARLVGAEFSTFAKANFHAESIFAGFTIQAPHTFYPRHNHNAREFYGVLSGTAEWEAGESGWQLRPPGTLIFHDFRVAHAMRTQEEPLLTTFVWVGDVFAFPDVVY